MTVIRTFFSRLKSIFHPNLTIHERNLIAKEHSYPDEFTWYEEVIQNW